LVLHSFSSLDTPTTELSPLSLHDALPISEQTRLGPPSLSLRRDRIARAISMVLTHKNELLDAMNTDFGARSRDMGMLYDIVGSVDRKSTRLNSSHVKISYAVFCLKKKKTK